MTPARVFLFAIAAVLLVLAVVVAATPTSISVTAGQFAGTRDCGSVISAKPDAIPDLGADTSDFLAARTINDDCGSKRSGRLSVALGSGIIGLTLAVIGASLGRRRTPARPATT